MTWQETEPAQTVIVDTVSPGWNYLVATSDPSQADPDFYQTWYYNDPSGAYKAPAGDDYDGPAFTPDNVSPLGYASPGSYISGLPLITRLDQPPTPRYTSYFTKFVDGGARGFANLRLKVFANDAAYVYLNGELIGQAGSFPEGATDVWNQLSTNSAGMTDVDLSGLVVPPGPNLLALSVHQDGNSSSTLGVEVLLTGDVDDGGDLHIVRGPYLEQLGQDQVTLSFQTDVPSYYAVLLGTSLRDLAERVQDDTLDVNHRVSLMSLTPNTKYYYQIFAKDGDGHTTSTRPGELYTFQTAPEAGTLPAPMRIWAVGDTGYGWSGSQGQRGSYPRSVYDAYRGTHLDERTHVWLLLGDNAYAEDGQTYDDQLQDALFTMYQGLLENATMWSTRGNHDGTVDTEPDSYCDVFSFAQAVNGRLGGVRSDNSLYFACDYGNVHFVCLDSWDDPNSDDMLAWREDDLGATTQDWIVAFFHHAPYSFGAYNSDVTCQMVDLRHRFVPMLEAHGVDLVLCAHSHTYERSLFIHGHYGTNYDDPNQMDSETFNPALTSAGGNVVQDGNGSDVGGVDASGNFVEGDGDGVYRKAAGQGGQGAVYVVCGSGSSLEQWCVPDYSNCTPVKVEGDCGYVSSTGEPCCTIDGGSNTVNPTPYPAMAASLHVMGSLVIDVSKDGTTSTTMHVQFIDNNATLRDDFSIQKSY